MCLFNAFSAFCKPVMRSPYTAYYYTSKPVSRPGCDPCYPAGTEVGFDCYPDQPYHIARGPYFRTCISPGIWDGDKQYCEKAVGKMMDTYMFH